MKRFLLLIAVTFGMFAVSMQAESPREQVLNKSQFQDLIAPGNTTFPRPFNEIGNPRTSPAVSTGYYFVDSQDNAPNEWRPVPVIKDTNEEKHLWKRVMPGPRILKGLAGTYESYWIENPEEGLRFFRNPAIPDNPGPGRSFFEDNSSCVECATDSTNDAIAGPIPIGFRFFFNGIRYDSFYVSTNGVVALTNRRYFYDSEGNRAVLAGSEDCYDPMSMDWFVGGNRGRDYVDNGSGPGSGDDAADNYGYLNAVCGGNEFNETGGIRAKKGSSPNNQNLSTLGNKAAIIAPFWADMQLSQWDADAEEVDDHGKVYYKRSSTNDVLTIYIVNMAPIGTKFNDRGQNYNAAPDLRPGDDNYVSASAQIVLDSRDSTVTINYDRFLGNAQIGWGPPTQADVIFKSSTSAGVKGYARHVDYNSVGGPNYPWANNGEYEQYTHYFNNTRTQAVSTPSDFRAVRFKQWKNTLRVVDIQYRVRMQDPDAGLEFAPTGCGNCIIKSSEVNNYELLAGEEKIGAIQPVVLIQNLTNDIQGPNGVNYQEQELNFYARFQIVNQANDRIVYNRLIPIDSTCLALPDDKTQDCADDPEVKVRYSQVEKNGQNYEAEPNDPLLPDGYNGIPSYGFVQVYFPPFEPNEFIDDQIGRMRAIITAEPIDPNTGDELGDQWPFDDQKAVNLFVMRRLEEFNDNVTEFHVIGEPAIPSVLKWVSLEADVVDGNSVSHHPLPPLDEVAAQNDQFRKLRAPVIHMNRMLANGMDPSQGHNDYKGDELRSFPIDMRGKYGAVLSLSIQRVKKRDDWERSFGDGRLIGPEPRTFINQSILSLFGERLQGTAATYNNTVSRYPDMIVVELMQPSPDRIQHITNVDEKRWRNHPRRDGAKPVTDMPAYKLFGSNGHSVGFLEIDPDSSLVPTNKNDEIGGFRGNVFDDGFDYEYKKAFIAIPDTFIRAENEGAKNFRFRIRVLASNDKKCNQCTIDDEDDFYVDNVKILEESEIADVEISAVKIIWPYTAAPASQAIAVPIDVTLSNNTNISAPAFQVKTRIWKGGPPAYDYSDTNSDKTAVYCRIYPLATLPAREEVILHFPSWNMRKSGDGAYHLHSQAFIPGDDLEPSNDYTTKTYEGPSAFKFDEFFSYDPVDQATNNVPENTFTGIPGRGLSLYGYAYGGQGRATGWSGGSFNNNLHGCGYDGGNGSGQFAVKFVLTSADTIYGYQAYFAAKNAANDVITFNIYNDEGGNVPSDKYQQNGVAVGELHAQRAYDPVLKDYVLDQYVTYKLPKPVVLPAGTYWISLAQRGQTGIELGASKSRMGMRTTSVGIDPPITQTKVVGNSGIQLMIEKNFRKYNVSGNLINNNFFAFENTLGSNVWNEFMPTEGSPAFAHLGHFGVVDTEGTTATLTRGSWIPMLRPYLGPRSYSNSATYDPCVIIIPVEFSGRLSHRNSNKGVELRWATSSEVDNWGFFVERRIYNSESQWTKIGQVKSAQNSANGADYSYVDNTVNVNTTYEYRVRSLDINGLEDCETSETIIVEFTGNTEITVNVYPNPVSDVSSISVQMPSTSEVTVEVLDIFGNLVKTLANNVSTRNVTEEWDATDNYGNAVANGNYILRVTSGNMVKTSRINVVK